MDHDDAAASSKKMTLFLLLLLRTFVKILDRIRDHLRVLILLLQQDFCYRRVLLLLLQQDFCYIIHRTTFSANADPIFLLLKNVYWIYILHRYAKNKKL